MSEATELQAAEERLRRYFSGESLRAVYGGETIAGISPAERMNIDENTLVRAYLASHPAATPTLDARAWMQRVWSAATAWARHVVSEDCYSEEQIQAAIGERERLTAELLPHLATSGQADDSKPITSAWAASLVGAVIDPTCKESTLLQIGGDTYVVIEPDASVAIQQGMYGSSGSEYIPIPVQPKTRGDLRRLCQYLGVQLGGTSDEP